MVADRYAGDTTWSRRIVREQPAVADAGPEAIDGESAVTRDRLAARAKATAGG
jgi:hypothetical protein